MNFCPDSLYCGDCLDVMRAWPDGCVDLCYLDPPFNSKADYNILFGRNGHQSGSKLAQFVAFEDTWTWDDAAQDRVDAIERALAHPAHRTIKGLRVLLGDCGMLAYVSYMAERLAEVRRLLKPTGSLYLHCDPTASHYIKVMMDGIFGHENFRNEIIWRRTGAHGGARRWGPIHDTLLFYSKGNRYRWNRTYQPYSPGYLDTNYTHADDRGRYQPVSLTGSGVRAGDSGLPWRGIDPTEAGRHWAIPLAALRAAFTDRSGLDVLTSQEKLDLLDAAGLIHWPERGTVPRQKRYADESPGIPVQDIVTDINPAGGGERMGYPTQKPLALLRRIIEASTNPGDVVLRSPGAERPWWRRGT